jgi:hypothetical protein
MIKLSTLAILLGALVAAVNFFALARPAQFTSTVRKFPRSVPLGTVLMLLATAWFVWNVRQEPIADFQALKPALYTLFIAVGIGSCIFVRDFLGARGAAVLALLLAQLMLDTARWSESPWRLVIVIWAYLMIVAGIVFTVSPWRLRDVIDWRTANTKRLQITGGIKMAFGLLVVVLGLTVFRH